MLENGLEESHSMRMGDPLLKIEVTSSEETVKDEAEQDAGDLHLPPAVDSERGPLDYKQLSSTTGSARKRRVAFLDEVEHGGHLVETKFSDRLYYNREKDSTKARIGGLQSTRGCCTVS